MGFRWLERAIEYGKKLSVKSVTSNNYYVQDDDSVLLVDASANDVNLEITSYPENRLLVVKKIDNTTNSVIITGSGISIDGHPQITINTQNDVRGLVRQGNEFFIIIKGIPDQLDISVIGSAETFLELEDTPDGYTGYANKVVGVSNDGSSIIFTDLTLPDMYTGISGSVDYVMSDITVNEDHDIILVNCAAGPVTITLPLINEKGIFIKKTDTTSNPVVIKPQSGKIEGFERFVLSKEQTAVGLVCDGNNWYIVSGLSTYGFTQFLALVDTDTLSGKAGYYVKVKSDGSGLDLIQLSNSADRRTTFLSLDDTPDGYSGWADAVLCVNQNMDGIEFKTVQDLYIAGASYANSSVLTADYTTNDNDCVLYIDASGGNITVNLNSTINGKKFVIRRIDNQGNNEVTIQASGSSIDERPSIQLDVNEAVEVVYDANNNKWYRVSQSAFMLPRFRFTHYNTTLDTFNWIVQNLDAGEGAFEVYLIYDGDENNPVDTYTHPNNVGPMESVSGSFSIERATHSVKLRLKNLVTNRIDDESIEYPPTAP